MARIVLPLPDRDFDTTEVAVPWKLCKAAGHEVVFATERGGEAPSCDPLLLSGVLFGQLGAEAEPIAFYRELERDPAFRSPVGWGELRAESFDGLLLAGGHAPGMRQYLDAPQLFSFVASFVKTKKPLGAICHGVLVLARTCDPQTGRSVLAPMRTTCLPKYMEQLAYGLSAWKLGRYYRTYDAYVEDEVRSALLRPRQFERGPIALVRRGTATDDRGTFVVEDGPYVSARWPGDAYRFARRFLARL